jgi:uncharacterized membrane protein YqaE (UPF0057 family)
MKKLLMSILVVAIAILTNDLHASFPVNQTEKSSQTVVQQEKTSNSDLKYENQTIKSKEKALKASDSNLGGDVPTGLLYVLCFFIPWLAVGLATDWDIKKVIINILWTMLCGIPGIIHAFIVVSKNS